MAMFIMDGKTFLKTFINEDPDKILKTQFVIVSSTIRKQGKPRYDKQIINANNLLYPSQALIMEYEDYKGNPEYQYEYWNQLDRAKALLATLISYTINENYTVVFLCGKKEMKYDYLKLIKKYVMEEFGFYIYDYKKFKNGKEKVRSNNDYVVLERCNEILNEVKREKLERQLSTEQGRIEYFSSKSKKELKKELKRRDLYAPGMSKSEMVDMLETFV